MFANVFCVPLTGLVYSEDPCGLHHLLTLTHKLSSALLLRLSAARERTSGHRRGQAPRNEGRRYPADPPYVEEIVLVMRAMPAIARMACRCAD